MGEYVQLGDVKTWYEVSGTGDPLVLLHGGLVDGSTWAANAPAFAERYQIFNPDRRGHGKSPDVDGPLTYDDMAKDTIAFLEQVVGGPAHLVGWSDGGNVALLVALQRPDLVRRLVLVSANFNHDATVPGMTPPQDPDAPDLMMLKAMYESNAVDPSNWPVFIAKSSRMWSEEPTLTVDDLKRVQAPTLVLVGDDDMVRFDHTTALYEGIPESQLAVLPGTSHLLVMEKAGLFNELVLAFLAETADPVTMMPIRRAPHA